MTPVNVREHGAFHARSWKPWVAGALLAALVMLALFSGETFWVTLAGRAAIFSIASVSLSFLIAQGGLVSFGHAASFGLGAYAALVASGAGITNALAVLPLAGGLGALFSAATGAVALRTGGAYFIMITLAFAQMTYFTLSSVTVLGGDDGMPLPSRLTLFGSEVLRNEATLAILALLVLAVTLYGFERLSVTRFGRVFRAARESESRVAALGYDPYLYRLCAYTLAGAASAMAGVLLANQTEFVSPSAMSWHQSGEFIVMAVLGLPLGLWGAVAGTAGVVILQEALGNVTEHWKLFLGLILIAVTAGRAWSFRLRHRVA
jgi:branched-chain amino acid transport system permease protein